jgi:hypothetical protein
MGRKYQSRAFRLKEILEIPDVFRPQEPCFAERGAAKV